MAVDVALTTVYFTHCVMLLDDDADDEGDCDCVAAAVDDLVTVPVREDERVLVYVLVWDVLAELELRNIRRTMW